MDDSQFKHLVYREIADVVSALGDPHRLEILDLLCQCERNVESLARMLDMGMTSVSHHLQVLKRARLVTDRKAGRFVYYSAGKMALTLWGVVSDLASRELAVVKCAAEDLFSESGKPEAVDYDELLLRIARGDAVLIDVRPEEEYAAGHVPGAVSVSLERLDEKASQLPRDKPIFAYCRGRYCVLSHEAARALARQGYSVSRLREGITEWKAADIPLESATR